MRVFYVVHFLCAALGGCCFIRPPVALAQSASGMSCKTDDDCGIGRDEAYYCSPKDGSCQRCHNCDPSDGDECPARCSCQSHDDCGNGEFCSAKHQKPQCVDCGGCNPNGRFPEELPFNGVCPIQCYCQSSSDCAQRPPWSQFCSSRVDGDPLENEQTSTPEGFGRCSLCYACVDNDILDHSADGTCLDVCSDRLECTSSDQCKRRGEAPGWCFMSNDDSEWFGSECRFSTSKRLKECWILSSWGEGYTRNECCFDDFGVSLGCPQSSCGWDVAIQETYDHQESYMLKWYVPSCEDWNVDSVVRAGWTKEDRSDLAADDFARKSTACQVTRYDAPSDEEWPRAVSVVDCTTIAPKKTCKSVERTVGIWFEAPNGTKTFLNEQHPKYISRIGRSDECAVRDAQVIFGLVFGVLPAVIIILCCCCFAYRHRTRRSNNNISPSDRNTVAVATSPVESTTTGNQPCQKEIIERP